MIRFLLPLLFCVRVLGAGFTESIPFKAQASSESLLGGLVGAWSFDEGVASGDRTNSLNSTLTLKDVNSNVPAIAGQFQGAADFSADSGLRGPLTNNLAATLGTGSFSFALWYIVQNSVTMIGQASPSDQFAGDYRWGQANNWQVWKPDRTSATLAPDLPSDVSSHWQFVVFGYDQANAQIFIYTNNGPKLTASLVGTRANATNFNIFWQSGFVDELYCWNRALTTAEVGRLWNSGLGLKYPFTTGLNSASGANVASNFQWNVLYNGGALPSNSTSNAISILADSLQSHGLWTNIYFALPFAPDSVIAAKTPIKWWSRADGNGGTVAEGMPQRKSTAGNQTDFVSGDLSVNGLAGSGNVGNDTKFLVSTFPGNDASSLNAVSHAQAVYVSSTNGGGYDLGVFGFGNPNGRGFWIGARNGVNSEGLDGNFSGNVISVASSGAGFYVNSRTSSTDHRLYFANTLTPFAQIGSTDSTAYSTAFGIQVTWLTENDANAGPFAHATADTLSWGSLHTAGLSSGDAQTLFNDVQTFRINAGGGFAPTLATVTNTPAVIGNSATIKVTTSLSSPTYQWKVNGTAIAGATQSSYTIGTVALSDFGDYVCAVTSGGLTYPSTPGQVATVTTTVVSNWVLCAENVNNNGATVSSNTIWAVDQFWNGMVTDGSSSKYQAINCYVPDSFAAALTPLITVSGAPYLWINHGFTSGQLTVNGLINSGSEYLDTGVTDSAAFSSVNDIGFTIYFFATPSDTGLIGIITPDFSGGYMLNPNRSGNAQWYDYGPSTGGAGNLHVTSPGAGYYCGTRTASNAEAFYFANSTSAHAALATGSVAPGESLTGQNIYIFNASGLTITVTGKRISYTSISKGVTSTDSSNQYSRVRTLRLALGGGSL
jgi:hypothetical protein